MLGATTDRYVSEGSAKGVRTTRRRGAREYGILLNRFYRKSMKRIGGDGISKSSVHKENRVEHAYLVEIRIGQKDHQ